MKKKLINLINSKKANRIATIIFVIFLILCVAVSIATKISIRKSISDFDTAENLIIENIFEDSSLGQIKSTEKNLKSSQTIVVAKFTGDRQSTHYATLSTVEVERVIKGDSSLKGKQINVYENNALSADRRKMYLRNFTPNNFFEKDKSYLIFTNKLDDYDGEYKRIKNIKNDEYAMTDYYLSCFCIDETDSQILDCNKENIIDYKDYSGSEFIVFSEKQKEQIYKFKSKILKEYL